MNIDIRIPYTTRPTMRKNIGPLFTPITSNTLKSKKKELKLLGNDLSGVLEEFTKNELLKKACNLLTIEQKDNIIELALTMNEDIAFLFKEKLVGICFCFPSNWIPSTRLGQTLSQIHQPVADNKHLVNASPALADTMSRFDLGSFSRQVWTLTTNKELSSHPYYKHPSAINIDDLYFRLETQTTSPLINGLASLFFVKVDVIPLKDIWATYGNQIKNSINSMTNDILVYKNLTNIKSLINSI